VTRFLLSLLAGAGLLLVATIGKQVHDFMQTDLAPAQAVSGHAAPLPYQAPAAVDPRIADWVAVAAARPLFSRDRRPAGEAVAKSADTNASGPLRLTGIIVTPFGRSAIFSVAGSAKPVVLEEGLKLGDMTVREIAVDHVVIDGPHGAETMVPSFGAPLPGGGPIPERPDAFPTLRPPPPGVRSHGERVAPRDVTAFGAPLQEAAP